MPLKRETPGVNHGGDPQDPRGMVKATLLEVQSRSDNPQSRRYIDSTRRHPVLDPLGKGRTPSRIGNQQARRMRYQEIQPGRRDEQTT
jgi:hypothetical protein